MQRIPGPRLAVLVPIEMGAQPIDPRDRKSKSTMSRWYAPEHLLDSPILMREGEKGRLTILST